MLCAVLPLRAQYTAADTMSYALGHVTAATAAKEMNFINTDEDRREFIRGLQEFTALPFADSTYMISYLLGQRQAIFLIDSYEHTDSASRPPLKCIIAGINRVTDGSVSLPQDTIDAWNTFRSLPDSTDVASLSDDEKCRIFTAYGILLGSDNDVQEIINGIYFGQPDIPEGNQAAFISGMAHMLDFYANDGDTPFETPYGTGCNLSINLMTSYKQFPDLDSTMFIHGAEAGIGLSPEVIKDVDFENFLSKLIQNQMSSYPEIYQRTGDADGQPE